MAAVDSDVTPSSKNEVQTLTLSSWDATDTIKLTWDSHESAAVTQASDCTAAFQAAIDSVGALSTAYPYYQAGDWLVSRTSATVYVFTARNNLANKDVSAITATNGTGSATGAVAETVKGDNRANRSRSEWLETIARTNLTPTTTVNRALAVPPWAKSATFVIDITITGTTPLFDFAVYGVVPAVYALGTRRGSTLDSTTDIYEFPTTAAITQLTTDNSTPTTTLSIGPGLVVDTTGSATANSSYSFAGVLPEWLIYKYVMDGTTGDEDYNGTISVVWSK